MQVIGQHTVNAPAAKVYESLIDPAILQQAIPGCERLEKTAEDEYNAHLKLGIASIKGSYTGRVKLSDKQPPRKFTMHMEGKGAPGFVKGSTVIELKENSPATEIHYHAQVQVGGLIAAIGSRLLEAVAKKMAAEFFNKFGAVVEGGK
jgi:carbon monoxide dehydrogenase subunit G